MSKLIPRSLDIHLPPFGSSLREGGHPSLFSIPGKLFLALLATSFLLALGACSPAPVADEGEPPEWTVSPLTTPEADEASPLQAGPVIPLGDLLLSDPTAQPAPGLLPSVDSSPEPPLSPGVLPVPPAIPLAGIEIAVPYFEPGLEAVEAAGAYWIKRNGLIWSVVESAEGQYNWGGMTSLEAELIDASERGLEMILIVRGTPFWAQAIPGYHCGPISTDKLPAFGDFLHAAVERYSQPPFNVKYWEIWNEPDAGWMRTNSDSQYGCWGDSSDPYYGGGAYGAMLKAVYPRMKEANPDAQVLVGGLLLDCDPRNPPDDPAEAGTFKDCTPAKFLEGILLAGGGDYFDGVSFHAYDLYYGSLGDYRNPNWDSAWNTTGPVLIAKSRFLRDVLAAYGYPDKYLLNTEVALLCGRNGRESVCRKQEYADSKAIYMTQVLAAAQAEGLRANVWFSLLGWRGSSLVSRGSMLPSGAYQAFSTSAALLEGAASLGEISYPGVSGYRFRRGEMALWIFWSTDGQTHPIELPRTPAAVYDIYGNPLPVGPRVDVTLSPLWAVFPLP